MALFSIISKLTGQGQVQPYNWLIEKSKSLQEQLRVMHFQRLYDYYVGDKAQIIKWTKQAMAKQFRDSTVEKMQLIRRSIVKKIINRTSLAYKIPAERFLDDEKSNDAYQECLETSNINVQAKEWNRQAKILDTVYVAPFWRDDHIEYDLFAPHLLTVKESLDNYLEPEAITYKMKRGEETVTVYWSDTEYYEVDSNGKRLKTSFDSNPYKILPFIPCRLRTTENHWGEGDTQLVDIVEQANILYASTYHNAIMQSHGIPVGINLGIPAKEQIETTPDRMIKVEGVRTGDVVPSLSFAQPEPATEACLLLIDNMFKSAAIDRGLTADSVSIDQKPQSGFAKEIDTLELMELREDDIEALRLFEKKLFQVTVAVWNYHSLKKITDLNLKIDFDEITVPKTFDEEVKEKEFSYSHGLWTPVDDLLDEDEGIDEAEAMKLIEHNLALKRKIQELSGGVSGRETNMVDGGNQQPQMGLNNNPGMEMVQGRAVE